MVLNSVRLTMNHSIVTDYCVTGDVSPQFLQTELPITIQLTPRTSALRNLTNLQAVKFLTLYGIRKFIITFLFRARSIQSKTSFHFLRILFNINLSPIFCYKCYFYLRFYYQNLVCIASLPMPASYPTHPILLDLVTLVMLGEEY